MMIKIFQATGATKIAQLEADINDWLYDVGSAVAATRTDIATCVVTDAETGKQNQRVIIAVWYDN
jgi:hypothetical protein